VKQRSSNRKNHILAALQSCTNEIATLAQVRHKVFLEEYDWTEESYWWRLNSWDKSFGRTIRSMHPIVHKHLFKPASTVPLGIAILDCLYRLPLNQIESFMLAESKLATFYFRSVRDSNGIGSRLCYIDFFSELNKNHWPSIYHGHATCSTSRSIAVVSLQEITAELIGSLSKINLRIGHLIDRDRVVRRDTDWLRATGPKVPDQNEFSTLLSFPQSVVMQPLEDLASRKTRWSLL